MLDWMIMPYKRYFDFSGRSRRKEYWSFVLLTVIVYVVFMALMLGGGLDLSAMSNPAAGGQMPSPGALFYVGAGLLGIWALASFIPNIAVVIRRLHDRDMSGWWLLGYFVAAMIPLLNIVAGIAMLVLMCLEGTKGPNRFGPDPKDPSSAQVFA